MTPRKERDERDERPERVRVHEVPYSRSSKGKKIKHRLRK